MSWARYAKHRLTRSLCLAALGIAAGPAQALCQTSAQAAGAPLTVEAAAPSEAEQARMLEAMRNYAADYTARLPNFICRQVVSQFEAGRRPAHWHKGDTLTSKLVFNGGKEERTLEAVNDKPVNRSARRWTAPLTTEGEFGMWLNNVFDPATETKFTWAGWSTLDGKNTAQFSYAVSQEHSTLSLALSDLAKAYVPFHGSVYADPQSGAVWRIVTEADDIPAKIRTRSSATTIDYSNIRIGTQDYLLPVKAQVVMVTDTNHIRNEMQFEGYRKFEAESTISFGDNSPDSTKSTPDQPHNPQQQ